VLLGTQFRAVVSGLGRYSAWTLARDAAVVFGVVVVVRLAWMFTVPHLVSGLTRRGWTDIEPWQDRFVLGWSGMRGALSLAAALAIGSRGFADRDLVIFIAYAVVVLTLAVPGLTLAPLLRRVGLTEDEARLRADAEARLRITHAALERLEDLAADGAPEHVVARLRERYESRIERLERRLGENPETEHDTDVAVSARLLAALIEAEREDLRRMRRERAYTTETLREIERELDLDESRLRARIRL
jgi:monovalent cation/hydrogen antiporter